MDRVDQTIIDQIVVMSVALSNCPDKTLYGPSKFWEQLSEKHVQLIRKYGFAHFKRTINFEYNQWGVNSLRSEQLRHVLKRLIAKAKFPYVALLAKSKGLNDVIWPMTSRHTTLAYKVFVGLLWQYACLEDRLGILHICEEPLIGGPLGITYRGWLISQDLAQSSLELNRIAGAIDMSKVRTIAEIGAGYGRLAYVIARMFPSIEYCIFDIPPALAISQNYLASALGKNMLRFFRDWSLTPEQAAMDGSQQAKIRAYLPHQLESFPDGYFDIVINISSFDEMMAEQVENYFGLIDRKSSGWVYLKGYAVRDSSDPARALGVKQFPYRQTWKKIYDGIDPVQPRFIERIYDLRKWSNYSDKES